MKRQKKRYNTRTNKYAQSDCIAANSMDGNSGISDDAKKYLDDLLRQYTTELKGEIDELKTLLNTKNDQIEELNEKVINVVKRNIELTEELRNTREYLEIKIDDNEQYSRKDSLRIEGIEYVPGETHQDLGKKIVDSLGSLGANVTLQDFHRYHRSSRPRTLENGRVVAQTIVRYNNWMARASSLRASQTGSRKERLARPQFVKVDITKRRLSLLKKAQNALHDHPIAHAFVNNECALKIKNRREDCEYLFNSNTELMDILAGLSEQ